MLGGEHQKISRLVRANSAKAHRTGKTQTYMELIRGKLHEPEKSRHCLILPCLNKEEGDSITEHNSSLTAEQHSNRTRIIPHLTVTFITLYSHAKLREAELQWDIAKLTPQNMVHSLTCLDTAPNEQSPESASGQKQTRKPPNF